MGNPKWVVKKAEPRIDYTIYLVFEDGSKKIYDAKPLLESPLYEPLKNLGFFMKARADGDTVIWNDDVDIAPEHLYECSMPVENMD